MSRTQESCPSGVTYRRHALINLKRRGVSPRVQSYIISLYDYVIKTVFFSLSQMSDISKTCTHTSRVTYNRATSEPHNGQTKKRPSRVAYEQVHITYECVMSYYWVWHHFLSLPLAQTYTHAHTYMHTYKRKHTFIPCVMFIRFISFCANETTPKPSTLNPKNSIPSTRSQLPNPRPQPRFILWGGYD